MTVKDLSGQSIKGYELHEMLGAGGFGAVYRAYQPMIKRDVAMKIILPEYANHPEFIRRFEFEAQLVARLEHLHIVALYDYWRDPQGAYLVMRWLRGGSLRGMLKKGPVDTKTAVKIVDQVSSALNTAHRRGVVHRDIKPDNILFDDEQNAYLADFGIAKDIHESKVDGDEDEGALTGSPFYLSPEQAKSLPVSPQTDLYSLGIVIYEMLAGQPPFMGDKGLIAILLQHINDPVPPVRELRPDLPPAIETVIQRATAKDPSARYSDALSLANDFRRALIAAQPDLVMSQPRQETTEIDDLLVITKPLSASTLIIIPGEEVSNPYKGLQAFQEADAAEFFGRDVLTERLLDRLAEPVELNRFLAVIGPSGSGKSSVVKAGMIPALRRGELRNSERWFMAEMVPGPDPFRELAAALLAVAAVPPEDLDARLRTDEGALADIVEQVLPPGAEYGILLTIDQFEEVFTLVEDEAARVHFLNLLLHAVTERDSRFRLIITLRADFYDRPLLYPGFGDLVRTRNEVVLPLTPEDMREAIVGPAERVGISVETGLVAAMIAEIGEQPGALPLLQYALTELFDRRENNVMTLDAYYASGGVRGALARRAEELYQECSPETQDAMRQVFLRMVEVGEGQDDTRRRVTQVELMALADNADVVMDLLDQLGKYRLLTFDHDPDTRVPVVSVAHEALIREWQRMRRWLDDSREDLLIQRRIAVSNYEWRRQEQDPSFLASGTRLDQFESLKNRATVALTPEELEYIDASIMQRAAQEEEERRRAEHEAMLEKRSRDRLRLLLAVMTVAAVIAGILAAVALVARQTAAEQRDKAERNAEVSASLALVANAQKELEKHNNELAIAIALEANRIPDPPREVQQILADAALAPGTVRVFEGHSDAVYSAAFSPDGQTALSGSRDNTLILWDVETGEILHSFEGHEDRVYAVAFSPDGQTALSASADNTVILWDISNRALLHRFEGHEDRVRAVAFSPDGQTALSSSDDDTVILWDIPNQALLHRFEREPAGEADSSVPGVRAVAFSPDGKTALFGYEDGSVVMWNLETRAVARTFYASSEDVAPAVAYSRDGLLVLAAVSEAVYAWDIETGQEMMSLRPGSFVYSVALDKTGQQVFVAANDNQIHLYDLQTGRELNRFVGHASYVSDVVVRPGSDQILSASNDGTLRLWSLTNGAEIRRYEGHSDQVWTIELSPDGTRILTAAYDGTVRIWNYETGEQITEFTEHPSFVLSAAFTPDGKNVLSSDFDLTLMLWDAETGEIIRNFEGLETIAWSVAVSPDGKTAVTGMDDARIIVWDLETGEPIRSLEGHEGVVYQVDISPDGQRVLSGADDGLVILWNINTGAEIRRFTKYAGLIGSVDFSPDGTMILAASGDYGVMWDAETGRMIRQFGSHTGGATFAVFSSDGTTIASSDGDHTVYIWNVVTGQEIRRLDNSTIALTGAFGPGDQTVISGTEDGTVRLLDAKPLTLDELTAWTHAHRYVPLLTCAQQRQYHLAEAPECAEQAAE
jgi:WD40 repeat protein/serine/threonine protein kinase/energy-coupling factor transporter ATP-binding protein EcfA2